MLKNETTWTPETSYGTNATPFDVPWRVSGDTLDNAGRLIFDLRNTDSEESGCSKIDNSGLTVMIVCFTGVMIYTT